MPADAPATSGRLARLWRSDVGWSFRSTPAAWISALLLLTLIVTAFARAAGRAAEPI